MSNVRTITRQAIPGKPLDWLARGLEAALKNAATQQNVMVTVNREEAMQLVRMIDEMNGDGGTTG